MKGALPPPAHTYLGNFHKIGIFQKLKLCLYKIFLCGSFQGAFPKVISLIWPNSQVMGTVAVRFENFMRQDDDCHCPGP